MEPNITPQLRTAVTDLITWYDELLDGDNPTLHQLAACIDKLKNAQPHPTGQIGADLAHIINPARNATRIDHVQAIERLRHLTRPAGAHLEQLVLGD